MNQKKAIIQSLQSISGKYSPHEVFSDWVRCCALSICNGCHVIHNELWKKREQLYFDTIHKYSPKEQEAFGNMLGILTMELGNGPADVLGEIYMESEMGSKSTAQFFTPYHLSELCADLAIKNQDTIGKIRLNEPACGSGGMIIATAAGLKKKGINYQKAMDVVAQDLEWRCVYMCYIQLSLLGIRAICVQGDTLAEPYDQRKTERDHILATPARMGMLI